MNKKPNTESSDFTALKKLGFNFSGFQDEFSYQPDSGSLANGEIGKQEYGISIDLDSESTELDKPTPNEEKEDATQIIPGESEWSQKKRLPSDTTRVITQNKKAFLNLHDRCSSTNKCYQTNVIATISRHRINILRDYCNF